MSFARVKLAGWAFGEILTSAQMNQLDIDHSNSVDGGAGGDYSPTAAVRLKGKGFAVGTALGDDTPFSAAASKWVASVTDFSVGSTIGSMLFSDVCSYWEGKLIATSAAAADRLAVSYDDGFSWRDASGVISVAQTITLQCCAATNDLIIAGGNSAKVYTGVDASTSSWSFITCGGSPTTISKMHYSGSLALFIAIGATAGAPYIATITTSFVATQRTAPASITGPSPGISITEATSGAHAGRLIATWTAQTKVAFSDDALTWTACTTNLTLSAAGYMVAFGDGVFVALASGGTSSAYTSSDGDIWSSAGVVKPGTGAVALWDFKAINGLFLAIDTASNAWISRDKCATWTRFSVQYSTASAIWNNRIRMRNVRNRMHILQTDGSSSVDLRGRKLGFGDGSA